MMKKYYFNMIEIILAIAIIAIGISSVMVLFTSGLRAGNEAVSGSNMPNVTETLIAHIRRLILSYADSTGWLSAGMNDLAPTVSDADWEKIEDDTIEGKIGTVDDTDGRVILPGKSGVKNYFLYRQLVATKVDSNKKPTAYATVFSAIAKVRSVSAAAPVVSDFVSPTKKWGGTISNDSNNKNVFSSALKVVEVVISYPADAPPESRESKIFRIEVFNDKYDRFANEYSAP